MVSGMPMVIDDDAPINDRGWDRFGPATGFKLTSMFYERYIEHAISHLLTRLVIGRRSVTVADAKAAISEAFGLEEADLRRIYRRLGDPNYVRAEDPKPFTATEIAESLGLEPGYTRRVCRKLSDLGCLRATEVRQRGTPPVILYALAQ